MFGEFSGSLSIPGLVLCIGLCLCVFGLYACVVGGSDFREAARMRREAHEAERRAKYYRKRGAEYFLYGNRDAKPNFPSDPSEDESPKL